MSSVPRYLPHYTVADYEQWEGDWELWEGVAVAMTPSPFGPHQRCSLRLARALLSSIEAKGCQAEVLQEMDWVIADDTVVRPDVLVMCGDVPSRHVTAAPAIVAEILSPTSVERDRHQKLRVYEENAVKYYLIVDPEGQSVSWYFRNEQGKLQLHEPSDALLFKICGDCELTVEIAAIF